MNQLDERTACNRVRARPDELAGHYESFFQRANHPSRPLAFWIRYTVTIPRGRPDAAFCELWAIHFDGESARITAVRESHPLSSCAFAGAPLALRIGTAELAPGRLHGSATEGEHRIGWSLEHSSPERPLLLLPERLYAGGFPKAKSLVGSPHASYRGRLEVDGARVEVDGWVGSQNHNWGVRHTDRYAWGQVAGFDGEPHAFLECVSAKIALGPVLSPWLSMVVLRLEGEELRLNSLWNAARSRTRIEGFDWRFDSARAGLRIRGHIHAPAEAFVALRYENPPGGQKLCMNSKIAACELEVERAGQPSLKLATRARAAFELLSDA